MNKPVIRSLCVLALLASIAVRVQANRTRDAMITDFDVGAAITDVIREHGYAVGENPVKPPKLLASVIYFQRPECKRAGFGRCQPATSISSRCSASIRQPRI